MQDGRPLAASIALHVGGLALFVHALAPRPRAATRATPAAAAQPGPSAPIAVAIVDESGLRPAERADEPAADRGTSGHAAARATPYGEAASAAAGGETAAASEGRSTPRGEPGPSSLMTMREPELRPGDAALESIAGSGDAPSPVRVSGRLAPATGGRGVIHDRVTTVNVERDGTAHFHDAPDIDVHLRLPIHPDIRGDLHQIGQGIADWYADPYAGERYGRTQDLAPHLQAEPGQCDTWGDSMCDDALAPEQQRSAREGADGGGGDGGGGMPIPILSGKLDITAYLMRKFHAGDPYASRKRQLLDDTRDERAARGGAFREEQLARSAELMERNLERLAAATRDPRDLREAAFELWDECAEGDSPTGIAGQRARAQVIGWIRARLPAGSAGAYTPAEIERLDAQRSSQQHFAPY